jgi:hypothetical protein
VATNRSTTSNGRFAGPWLTKSKPLPSSCQNASNTGPGPWPGDNSVSSKPHAVVDDVRCHHNLKAASLRLEDIHERSLPSRDLPGQEQPDLPPMARSGQAGVRCMAGGPRRWAAWTRPLCCRCSRLRQRRVAPRALRISSVKLPPPWPASPRTRSALPGQAWCRCHAVSRGLETS